MKKNGNHPYAIGRVIAGLETMRTSEEMNKLGWLSFQKTSQAGHRRPAFKRRKSCYKDDGRNLFPMSMADRRSSNGIKLQQERLRLNIRENY